MLLMTSVCVHILTYKYISSGMGELSGLYEQNVHKNTLLKLKLEFIIYTIVSTYILKKYCRYVFDEHTNQI